MKKTLITTKKFSQATPQPPEGYFPLSLFTPFSFHPTGIATTEYREENIHPGVVGLMVTSLIKTLVSGDRDKGFHFAFRTKGRNISPTYCTRERGIVRRLLNEIDGLTPQAVYAARQLAKRVNPVKPSELDEETESRPPDDYTVQQIISMVEDTTAFFREQQVKTMFATFSATDRYRVMTGNEHSILTDNTLWRLHVSHRDPDKKETLRLMAAAILAQTQTGIARAGIVNVRLRKAYICDLNDPLILRSLEQVAYLMRKTDDTPERLEAQ